MTYHDDDLDRTERDIDAARAAIEERLRSLEERLLSREAVDDALGYARRVGAGGRDLAEGVARAARANPIPTALVGLGLGWLAYELLHDRGEHHAEYEAYDPYAYDPYADVGPYTDAGSRDHEESGRMRRARERVREAGHYAGEQVRSYAHRTGEAVRHGGESADRFVRQHPLATGATVFAVGIALGALVTSSADDRRRLRRRMDETARAARRRFRHEAERARTVAGAAADAAREEAHRQYDTEAQPKAGAGGAAEEMSGVGRKTTGKAATDNDPIKPGNATAASDPTKPGNTTGASDPTKPGNTTGASDPTKPAG